MSAIEDVAASVDALKIRRTPLSVYHLRDKTKIWVITEADRSATCGLLLDEYEGRFIRGRPLVLKPRLLPRLRRQAFVKIRHADRND